jgi:hypothetical protein
VQWLPLVDKSQWPPPPVRFYSMPLRPPLPQQQQAMPQMHPAQQQQMLQLQQLQAQLMPQKSGSAAAPAAAPAAPPQQVQQPQVPAYQGPPVEPIPQGFPRLTAMHRDPSPAGEQTGCHHPLIVGLIEGICF